MEECTLQYQSSKSQRAFYFYIPSTFPSAVAKARNIYLWVIGALKKPEVGANQFGLLHVKRLSSMRSYRSISLSAMGKCFVEVSPSSWMCVDASVLDGGDPLTFRSAVWIVHYL